MSKKKKYIIILLSGIIIFLVSYTITMSVLINTDGFVFGNNEAKAVNNTVVSKKSNIKFILNYKNSLDTVYSNDSLVQPINIQEDKLEGLSKDEVSEIFSSFGYDVTEFDDDKIVLTRDMDGYNYDAGTYFIGINNDNVSVLRKNSDGSISVQQAEIANPRSQDGKQSPLSIKDIENKGNLIKTLYEGRKEYQFSDIQEAIEYAQALCST